MAQIAELDQITAYRVSDNSTVEKVFEDKQEAEAFRDHHNNSIEIRKWVNTYSWSNMSAGDIMDILIEHGAKIGVNV